MYRFTNGLRSVWWPPWAAHGYRPLPPVKAAQCVASRWAWGLSWQTRWREELVVAVTFSKVIP